MDSTVSIADTERELADFFQSFGEVSNLKLMQARKPNSGDASSGEEMLGFGFVCFKSVEDA